MGKGRSSIFEGPVALDAAEGPLGPRVGTGFIIGSVGIAVIAGNVPVAYNGIFVKLMISNATMYTLRRTALLSVTTRPTELFAGQMFGSVTKTVF